MIKIRFSRRGFRNKPQFRIVVCDSSKKMGGEYLDLIGFYNPIKKVKKIDQEKLKYWISKGGKMSLSVKKLLA